MKKNLIALVFSVFFAGLCFARENNVLVVYFSKSGNTRTVAHYIAYETGGTVAQISAVESYSEDKNANMERAEFEFKNKIRPEIVCDVSDLSGYDVIFVGYPLWCGHAPAPVLTFLESYDFSGKTIVPFVTYGGSPFARGTKEVKASAPNAVFKKTISVKASSVPKSEKKVRSLVRNLIGSK